jgi:hypothetical protein
MDAADMAVGPGGAPRKGEVSERMAALRDLGPS